MHRLVDLPGVQLSDGLGGRPNKSVFEAEVAIELHVERLSVDLAVDAATSLYPMGNK